jgi:alpha-tubulin suppressor-like RCC1 family protein
MTGGRTTRERGTSTRRRRGLSVVLSAGLVAASLTLNVAPAGASAPVIISISAGVYHTCAVASTGAAQCWGRNTYGELGDGTTTQHSIPVQVSGLTGGVSAVSAGDEDTCARSSAGDVKCWGFNSIGQLGDGTTTDSSTPVQVSGLTSGVSAVAVDSAYACAVTGAGAVKCWGFNVDGQLGDGTTTTRSTPVQVSGLTSGMSAVAVGSDHACALSSAGGVKCWGGNAGGGLGDGTTTDSSTPVQVSGLTSGVSAIAAGSYYTCAVASAGALKCWGNDTQGELGDGMTTNSSTPVQVSGLTSGVSAVSAGSDNTCAVTSAGALKCWGINGQGELGDGMTTNSSTPVQVSGLTSGVSTVAVGSDHACALSSAGGVKCWGGNASGGLGDGTVVDSSVPVDVFGPTISDINNSVGTTITSAGRVPVTTTWIGADPSATITSYQAQEQIAKGAWRTVALTSATATSLTLKLIPAKRYNVRIRATDSLGNKSVWSPGVPLHLDGSQDASSYAGTWVTQALDGAWGGTVSSSTELNASASFGFRGRYVAWVGTKGPGYGSAAVYVDGVYWTTINCHGGSSVKRRVLFRYATALPTNYGHTIQIVNLATAGHPRIDIDGFVSFETPST